MVNPWVDTTRRATGLVEHVCEHGVGHPAVGSIMWMNLTGPEGARRSWGVHGCCGCCRSTEWQLADALEGLKIANELLFKCRKELQ